MCVYIYVYTHTHTHTHTLINLVSLVASVVNNPPANAGNMSSIPGLSRSPGEGNGNPLQYSCLGNPMDRGAWGATVHGVSRESHITQRLSNNILSMKCKIKTKLTGDF